MPAPPATSVSINNSTGKRIFASFAKCAWTAGPEGVPLLDGCPDRFVGRRTALMDPGADHVQQRLDHRLGAARAVEREQDGYRLRLELPFTSKDEIALSRKGDELVLQVGGWRRNLVLPRLLLDAPTQGAKMEDRVLKVRFAEPIRRLRPETSVRAWLLG